MPNGCKNYCGTSFQEEEPRFEENECSYLVYQREAAGSTGREHWQFYVEFKKRTTIRAARDILRTPGAHLESRRGTPKQASDYCQKIETRLVNTEPVVHGEISLGQGARNDIIALRDAIRGADSIRDLLDDNANVSSFARYGRFAERVWAAHEEKLAEPWRTVHVSVYWGKSGAGKTKKALEYYEGAKPYIFSAGGDKEWWDGYNGQKTIVIDEFYGQLRPCRMQRLLDGHMCRLEIKGGHCYARWTKVFITSNTHPDCWYGESIPQAVKDSLNRRYSEIIQF